MKLIGCVDNAEKFLEEWNNDLPYIVAHTSGSTGKPKEIHLLKSDMEVSARATCRFFNIGSQSTLYLPLPVDYIAGKMMIVRALVSGAALYLEKPTNRPMNESICTVDLLAIVPSQMAWFVGHPEFAEKVRNVIIGGGAIDSYQERQAAKLTWKAYASYGMTETCSHVALRCISKGEEHYTAMPGVTFSVDSRDCLVVHTPQFSFDSVVTNDIVKIVDSRHFYWLGRYDNVINTGGIKVFPEEIEQKLEGYIEHPFFIIGRKSEKWGEEVVLYIESRSQVDVMGIIEKAHQVLKPYCVPKEVIVVDCFQRTESGKIKRRLY